MRRRTYAISPTCRTAVDAKTFSSLGEPDSAAPYLHVEIYRPGSEIRHFADPEAEIAEGAGGARGQSKLRRAEQSRCTANSAR